MFIGVAIFLILMLMGGMIAFLGDKIGSKVGKKKMTLFGLRPRYTSIIVTIISGVLISFLTIAVLAVVNENVRVALFGLNKLQTEMAHLNQEIKVKNQELAEGNRRLGEGQKQLEERNKEYDEVTRRAESTSRTLARVESQRSYIENELTTAQNAYEEAKKGVEKSAEEIKTLENVKTELSGNIEKLNKEKQTLISSIAAIREGVVVFRAGQVLTDAVVDEHMTKEQSEQVLASILNDINNMLIEKMNITDKNAYLIRISQTDFDEAVNKVTNSEKKKLLRIISVGNIILGEPAVVTFDVHDNNLIFHKNETILTAYMYEYKGFKQADAQVLSLLSELNSLAQKRGVLSDPITGKVGKLEGQELINVIEKVKNANSRCTLIVKAKTDIYTEGPLLITVKVKEDN